MYQDLAKAEDVAIEGLRALKDIEPGFMTGLKMKFTCGGFYSLALPLPGSFDHSFISTDFYESQDYLTVGEKSVADVQTFKKSIDAIIYKEIDLQMLHGEISKLVKNEDEPCVEIPDRLTDFFEKLKSSSWVPYHLLEIKEEITSLQNIRTRMESLPGYGVEKRTEDFCKAYPGMIPLLRIQ